MSTKSLIRNYILASDNLVNAKQIMSALGLRRAIVDKWLSELANEGIIFRVSLGRYFKIRLTDYTKNKEELKKLKLKYPRLINIYHCAVQRCQNVKHPDYKYYGAKGIRVKITFAQFVEIWLRDKGYLLKNPSIDRFDSSKSYTKDNARFIEFADNVRRAHKKESKNITDPTSTLDT